MTCFFSQNSLVDERFLQKCVQHIAFPLVHAHPSVTLHEHHNEAKTFKEVYDPVILKSFCTYPIYQFSLCGTSRECRPFRLRHPDSYHSSHQRYIINLYYNILNDAYRPYLFQQATAYSHHRML